MSPPSLEAVAATLRDFVARAEALRAVALLDRGADAAPAVVDCGADGAVDVEVAGEAHELRAGSEDRPLAVSARAGEPPVIALGERAFTLPPS